MRRSVPQLPELRDTCRHYDTGLPCGIDGGPCVGYKEEVRVSERRGHKKVTVAKYRRREVWRDAEGNEVEGPWVVCPKLRRQADGEPAVPGVQ